MRYIFLTSINNFDFHVLDGILKKNKINFIIKSTYESSVMAGWMTPASSFNEKFIFIDKNQLDQAEKILQQYITDYNQ